MRTIKTLLLCLVSLIGYSQNDSIVFNLGAGNFVTIYKDGHAKRLPPLTGNNNKVLTILNGVYSWQTPTAYNGSPATIVQNSTNRFVTDAEKTTWGAKQDALVSGTNIKTVNSQSLLGSGNIVISGSGITNESDQLAFEALGSPIKAETVGQKLFYSNTSTALVDGQIKFTAVYLPAAATLTGIKVYVRVLGAYTGDNNNRIGLYSYSAGVLTLVASSANNATLWTSAANAVQTIPFSSTYSASAGIYFVGILYNNSAQTTAPSIASGVALNNLVMGSTVYGFTNSAKLHGTANGTDLTTPINMTAITSSVIPTYIALY